MSFFFGFADPAPCSCQIAFQGVRRVVGPDPFQSKFRYKPKAFTYKADFDITVPGFLNFDPNQPSPPIVVVKDVDDYDFELHEVKIVYPQDLGLPSVVTKVLLYDQNRYPISNIPMLDVFINRLGYYKNGAVMNPLFYQQNSQIRMELFSVLQAAQVPVTGCEVQFIGIQRYPC
jgi:hypothetical protein